MNSKAKPISFDRVADAYDETRIVSDLIIEKAFMVIDDKVDLSKNRIILEAGIGTGRTCKPWSNYDVEISGIDISLKMLRKCQERIREISVRKFELIQADIICLPFKSSTFDITILMHVFDLIKRRKEAIKEIKRIMKTGGFLIIMQYINPLYGSIITKKYRELHRKRSSKNILKSVCNRIIPFPIYQKIARLIYGMRFNNVKKLAVSVQTESIKWTQRVQTSQILNNLEKRVYSDYWDTPDKTQSRIMKELKKWMEKEGVGDSEGVKCNFEIIIFKF